MISCLTVTQPGRLATLQDAVRCFERQTHEDRELVVVHDGDDVFETDLSEIVEAVEADVQIVRVDPGRTLGALRNISLESARGEVVCQWDDDDFYHPQRLEVQYDAMRGRDAAACLLVDQLHLFEATRELYWDDWTSERFPMSLVQGTLMAQRSVVGPYPDRRRGEDTPALMALVSAGRRVAALQDMGYLYVYRFHGLNAWDERHHRAISAAKARSGPVLEEGRAELEEHLRAYPVPQRVVSLVDGTRRVPLILGSPNTGQSMGL